MSKILLVEDDNNLREIYEARLQAEGYTIISAKDGEEALVFAKSEKPDLVISDVMMPKISGFEMLDILRNTDGLKHVKVIMLTALGQSDDQQRANRLGADHYLVKSQVTLEDIVKVAHELLQDEPEPAQLAATPVPTPQIMTPPVTPDSASTTPPASAAPDTMTPPAITPPSLSSAPVTTAPSLAVSEPVAVTVPTAPVAADPTVISPTDPTTTSPSLEPSPVPTPDLTSMDENSNSVAQSAAQEAASVESKIEDFVDGASSTPNQPDIQPNPEASVQASESVATTSSDTAAATSASNSATDDKVMADALNNLIAGTQPSEAESAEPKIAGITASITPPTNASEPTGQTSTAIDGVPEPPPRNDNVTIAHKKIIEPVDSVPKQDLSTLLAIEAEKDKNAAASVATAPATSAPAITTSEMATPPPDDSTSQPTTNAPTVGPPPAVPPPIPGLAEVPPPASTVTEDKPDPNSIAL